MKALIKNGADVNAISEDNETSLHMASKNKDGDIKIVEILLKNGADPNILNKNGENALNLAVFNGN